MMIAIWELAHRAGVELLGLWNPSIFPSPLDVFKSLVGLITDRDFGMALMSSLRRMAIGYAVSLVIGSIAGLILARFRYLDESLSGLILGLQTLPNVCWLPFAILWYGYNENAIIFVIAIGSTFAITIAIESGIKNVDPVYLRAAKTMGASGMKIYRHVALPASLPVVVAGMKQGWSFAWRGLIAGEMLTATRGLGQVLTQGRDSANVSQIVAVMVVIVACGLLVDKLVFGQVELNVRERWGLDRT